jgi:hypothetical protein
VVSARHLLLFFTCSPMNDRCQLYVKVTILAMSESNSSEDLHMDGESTKYTQWRRFE